jgi:CubicO group peptidase (beta-lactamase class C family)
LLAAVGARPDLAYRDAMQRLAAVAVTLALALAAAPGLLAAQQQKAATQELDCEAAAEFSAENAGLAVLVYQSGELVFERYQNGHRQDRAQHIFSGTKSFAPMVALVAQDEGLLDLDEKVCETITEWRGDEKKEQITIRHLLNFTSGLENIDAKLHSPRVKDVYGDSIACACVRSPGTRFRYGSNHLMVFGEVMKRKLAAAEAGADAQARPDDFVAYLEDRILEPIGCRYTRWMRDSRGNPALPYGAYMTAREWGKFGLLVQHRGKHGEAQLVPTAHFDECFVGSKANPVYGLNFWLVGKRVRSDLVPEDLVSAAGMFNQKLYISESADLVVVRLGRTGARTRFGDRPFLVRLFGG